MSPILSRLETTCEEWLKELFGLPAETVAGFVSGTSSATMCGLAAGRNEILKRRGWDVNTRGLFGAPNNIEYSRNRDGMLCTPEMSRRARAIGLWATLKALGRSGVEELVDGLCQRARQFAGLLRDEGFHMLNDIVFNQVLVSCVRRNRPRKPWNTYSGRVNVGVEGRLGSKSGLSGSVYAHGRRLRKMLSVR